MTIYGAEAHMNVLVQSPIPVTPETAEALTDSRRALAVGRLVDRMVRPVAGDDPLADVLRRTQEAARNNGLTDADIDAELAAFRAERTQR